VSSDDSATKPGDSFVHRLVKRAERPYRLATRLAFFGLLGTIVGAYFQYNSWRDEKNLTRYRDELTTATATFSELSFALSSVMNLQQMLFYTHRDAYRAEDSKEYAYLLDNAKRLYENYFLARTSLRQNIDILSGKAGLFIDRPVESDEQRVQKLAESGKLAESNFVVSNRDSLKEEKFSCAEHMPNRSRPTRLKNIVIDWNSVRQQTRAFYFCSDDIHYSLLPVRIWAQSGVYQRTDDEKSDAFISDLNRQARRLNTIISTSLEKIEQLRLRGRPKGFFRHQLFCWWSCSE
jgi:hypothetical protein